MKKTVAIILAGGIGKRFRSYIPKQFLKIAGRTVLEHTIEIFENHSLIEEIFIVINPLYYDFAEEILNRNKYKKVKKLLKGGSTRQESSKIGILACDGSIKKVLIHDAVRPFVSDRIITEVIRKLDEYPAVDVGIPATDTIIRINRNKMIVEIPERESLYRGQTPQGFLLRVIKKAHLLAEHENFNQAPDDCSLILRYNLSKIYVVKGEQFNIKISYPQDMYIADRIFQLRTINLTSNIDIEKRLRKLNGKVIVVFGGNSGIGREIVRIGKNFGAFTYGFSRSNGVDITKYEDVERALSYVETNEGKIDIVINSAAELKRGYIENLSLLEIRNNINVNLIGSIIIAKLSIPYLKKTKGSIIFFTSSSYTKGRPGYATYSLSKAAIVNLTQALSEEVCRDGIKVNAICPERTKTPLRFRNFGKEPDSTLLSPRTVAYVSLLTAISDFTGQVVDVRKNDESKFIKSLSIDNHETNT